MIKVKIRLIILATAEFDQALKLLNSQNLKKFDPFDKVILSTKGIDNSILTSLRTLAKLNNSISDSFKVIHTKFAPYQLKNPHYAYKKLIPQAERNYGSHPPIDMSTFAEDPGRAFSMGPPLKGVYKNMVKPEFSDLPKIDENPRRGFVGSHKPMNQPHKVMSDTEESLENPTMQKEPEMNIIQSPKNQEIDTLFTGTNSLMLERKKISKIKSGGFRINVSNKKRDKPLAVPRHKKNDLSVNYTKGEYAHLLNEIGVRNDHPNKASHHKKSKSLATETPEITPNILKGTQSTVRGLIDQMYKKEKKYTKQYFKEDFIQKNDFIFNLDKTHQLRLAKSKNNESSQMSTPAEPTSFGL